MLQMRPCESRCTRLRIWEDLPAPFLRPELAGQLPDSDEGDLGRAVQASRDANGPQAWIGVEDERADAVKTPIILAGQRGQVERGKKRKADLSPVGVA